MKNWFLVFLCLFFLEVSAQKKTVNIGMLLDQRTSEVEPLISFLQSEIEAVVGEDAQVVFSENNILTNNTNKEIAKSNYSRLVRNETDIILAFGNINNVVITEQKVHVKPTILFGAVNRDFITLPESQTTSGINNLSLIITTHSINEDLKIFKELFEFKKVGIAIESYVLDLIPVKPTLDKAFNALSASYEIMPFNELQDITNQLDNIDALYFAGGFFLTDQEIQQIALELIDRKIPSFTGTHRGDVEAGLLATNQPDDNLTQMLRRIALGVEAIVNGENASELPMYLDYEPRLTLNYNTAEKVGVAIKYSYINNIEFVGDFKNVLSEKKYNLLEVMQEVVNKNLGLQASKKSVELSAQDIKTAKSNYLPDVSAVAIGTHVDPDLAAISFGQSPEYSTTGSIQLSQTIFSEAANANIAIQRNLNEAQQEQYNVDELDAIFNVSNAYFNSLILKANLQIQSQNLDLTKRNLQIAEQNFEAGQGGKSDVLRFRSQLAQNTQLLVEAANQLELGFLSLNQLLNNPIDYNIDVEEAELDQTLYKNYNYDRLLELLDDPNLRKPFINFLVQEAIRNAPEMRALSLNEAVTERNIRLNGTGRILPTLALQGQYNRNIDQWGVGVPETAALSDNYNVSLSLSIPIFKQNLQNINKQSAVIQRDQIRINQQNTKLNIARNVNEAVLGIMNQISNIKLSEVAEITAKESLELTQISYSNGAVNIVQLLDAQNNYLQAQLAKANATYNYLINTIQLERYIAYYFLLHTKEENQQFVQKFRNYIASVDNEN